MLTTPRGSGAAGVVDSVWLLTTSSSSLTLAWEPPPDNGTPPHTHLHPQGTGPLWGPPLQPCQVQAC